MTPREAAEWMVEELSNTDWLDQETVAWELTERNQSLTYMNDNGNLAISKEVLAEFNRLTADGNVVWSRSQRHWRYRELGDEPGRMQY